jgi:hypothetical protein
MEGQSGLGLRFLSDVKQVPDGSGRCRGHFPSTRARSLSLISAATSAERAAYSSKRRGIFPQRQTSAFAVLMGSIQSGTVSQLSSRLDRLRASHSSPARSILCGACRAMRCRVRCHQVRSSPEANGCSSGRPDASTRRRYSRCPERKRLRVAPGCDRRSRRPSENPRRSAY